MNRGFTTQDLIRARAMVKDRIAVIDDQAKQRKALHVSDLELIDDLLLADLQRAEFDNGATSIKTPAGTVYYKANENYTIADSEAFFDYFLKRAAKDPALRAVIANALSKPAMREYLEKADEDFTESVRTVLAERLDREPTESEVRQEMRDRALPTLPGVKRTRFETASVRKK